MRANSLRTKISLTSKLKHMEKNDCTLQQEVDRIMLLDISSSEKNRMLSDLYCSTYMIMVSGLGKEHCRNLPGIEHKSSEKLPKFFRKNSRILGCFFISN